MWRASSFQRLRQSKAKGIPAHNAFSIPTHAMAWSTFSVMVETRCNAQKALLLRKAVPRFVEAVVLFLLFVGRRSDNCKRKCNVWLRSWPRDRLRVRYWIHHWLVRPCGGKEKLGTEHDVLRGAIKGMVLAQNGGESGRRETVEVETRGTRRLWATKAEI